MPKCRAASACEWPSSRYARRSASVTFVWAIADIPIVPEDARRVLSILTRNVVIRRSSSLVRRADRRDHDQGSNAGWVVVKRSPNREIDAAHVARKEIGVPDGFRTRDLLSHSQAFYP